MKRQFIVTGGLLAVLMFCGSAANAQLNNQGGGIGGLTGGAGGTTAGASAAGTTEGIGGLTTQGIGAGPDAGGGEGGSNAAASFIGQNAAAGFVGGALESSIASNINRQFRALQSLATPTGGTQQQTGTPRQVPVSFRVGFTYPAVSESVSLSGPKGISISQFATRRPELQSVQVALSEAGVATLSGTVPDSANRRLAENLMRIEPGVRSVVNQIEVSGEIQ
jgi:hypothetical protein